MRNPITQLLLDNNLQCVKLDKPYLSTLGNITEVGRKHFGLEDGADIGEYDDLEDYDFVNLLYDVESKVTQITISKTK